MKSNKVAVNVLATMIRMLVAIVLIFIIYRVSMTAYDFGFRIFAEEPMTAAPGRDVTIRIEPGSGARDIGKVLENNGLIRDASLFLIQETLSEHKGKTQPGSYTLNTSMTAEQMLEIMSVTEEEEAEE